MCSVESIDLVRGGCGVGEVICYAESADAGERGGDIYS